MNRQYFAKIRRFLSAHNRSLFVVLAVGVFAISAYLVRCLIKELTTPNYHFYGTHYDFLAFYTAGKMALHNHTNELYQSAHVLSFQRHIIPHPVGAVGYMPFLNPPFVSALLAPLALFNINTARLVWLVISIGMAVFIIYQLTKPLPARQRLLAVGLLLLTYPLYQTFIEGQVSILVLFGATLSYLFLKRRQKLLSGASLVLLWVIPQFGIFAAAGLVVKREWQILKGWLMASIGIVLITLPLTGLKIYMDYIKILASTAGDHFVSMNTAATLTWRGAVNLTMGLNGFFSQLIGEQHTTLVNVLYVIASLTLLLVLGFAIRKVGKRWTARQEALLFSAALFISCLIDPHVFAQDVIVMLLFLPALLVLYKRYALRAVIVFAAYCNLVFLDQYSRLHFFALTTLIGALVYLHISRKKQITATA